MDWPEAVTFSCWGICSAFAYWAWLRSAIRHRELAIEEQELDFKKKQHIPAAKEGTDA